MSELSKELRKTRDYFEERGFTDWVAPITDAIVQEQSGDYSFVDSLWLKFGDTCEVDNLLITDYEPEKEDEVNVLNSDLAQCVNSLFLVLDDIVQKKHNK